ncbi:heme ABC transporter ATP-binding protein [Brachybacterium sp. AOP43-C2-M15]|uniref:heme ABC transporter ATP-binding protein n=1 Tax=Brachybacterium sp. AOP43-C2-M15 TaxID=3457661 RepID=UPI004034ECA8
MSARTAPGPRPEAPCLEVRGVGFTIGGARLLEGVSFSAAPGELVAMVGPNGAGKSTMLALLAGDLVPSEGTISLAGTAPHRWPAKALARQRSVMTQQHGQAFSFTVRELVEMGRAPHDASDRDEELIDASLVDAEIAELAHRDVTTLSGGELARAVFARTLTQDAGVVLLDEPTAPLDLRHQETLMQRARSLADEGRCVLVVLHDLSLAARFCDRLAVFSEGSLTALGPPEQVLTPERIEQVYRQRVAVLAHPVTGRPLVVPV